MRLLTRSLVMMLTIAAVLMGRSAYAGVTQRFDLVLTENSSSDLSLSYNGPAGAGAFTVMNTSPDHWTIQVNNGEGVFLEFNDFDWFWEEPEDPVNSANEVYHSTDVNSDQIFVISDLLADALANGTSTPTPVGFEDDQQFGNIFLTFIDKDDEAPTNGVPDSGSTAGMFVVAAVVLLGANRVRSLRLVYARR